MGRASSSTSKVFSAKAAAETVDAGQQARNAGLLSVMRAELLKIRRTPILSIHLVIPLCTAGIFLLYYAITPYSPTGKVQAYIQVLGGGMPLMVCIIAAFGVEQERNAGKLAHLCGASSRRIMAFGKLLFYIVMGMAALLLAALVFAGGMTFLGQNPYPVEVYLICVAIIGLSSSFCYVVGFALALRFGRNAAVIAGVAASLISFVMLTGLGSLLWPVIPSAWPAHLASDYLSFVATNFSGGIALSGASLVSVEVPLRVSLLGIIMCVLVTSSALLWYGWWVERFEAPSLSE